MIKPYPIGKQDFRAIIQGGYAYVDKTEIMYRMIQNRTFVFLSRPRRFGKSLLVNTLDAYFSGEKELFKDLAIYNLEKDWIKYEVIRLDMSKVKDDQLDTIKRSIGSMILEQYEKKYNIPIDKEDSCGARFQRIIQEAFSQSKRKVVIIVDEYDSPLLAHLHDGHLNEYKQILQNIYQQLKTCEQYEQFVFITGISRFSQVSIFSTLNNLQNISMDTNFSDICGITKKELTDNFREDIQLMADEYKCSYDEMIEKLKFHYDGYHFTEELKDIFNPLSVLSCLDSKKIKNYWFETATSSYVINHLKHFSANILEFEGIELFESGFYVSHEDFNSIYPLLYQSGYLTIKGYDDEAKTYIIGYPNNEVRVSMMQILMPSYIGCSSDIGQMSMKNFYFSIKKGEYEKGFDYLKTFLASIPNELNNKKEKDYQTILYVLFTWLGFYTQVEVSTAIGRMDMVIYTKTNIYIFEFKVNKSAEEAMKQIHERNYEVKFKNDGREIVKFGINISSKKRTIDKWIMEK